MIELTYKEIDSLLYPEINIGENRLRNLGRFGKARLEYLHKKCFEYYRKLLITGKLAEHCEEYDMRGYELAERLQEEYIEKHPLPDDDFMKTVRIRTKARDLEEEVVISYNM